ncbi:glycosyltransferase family 4 protein [Sabulibacter ruber]|uniref:glycosyltransferase family 4 protein n=1 Tax=Sabulibacter ruber TaxID=2811901 RepID=UPI001A97166E|nr:glycosyltransferase family 1 protein [Sabulibacter ruber]
MRIILIGNYSPDRQESMERFAQMLAVGFQKFSIEAAIWRPIVLFGTYSKSTTSGIGKWLGYIDKWLLFPLVLRVRLAARTNLDASTRFHICDHSNAPYFKYLPADKTAITVHDVLAIRGGLGYSDAYAPASGMGRILQKWILHHLSRARFLASVSQFTFKQLTELTPASQHPPKDWRVIYNAFNADFRPVPTEEKRSLLRQADIDLMTPFLLHVGSGLARKNRKLLIDMVHALGSNWTGNICYAGEPADEDMLAHARSLGLENRIFSVVKPNHATLRALYNACEAFVFPSFSEGFGWPLIEAQACGTPVISSNIEPMPEVSGGAALYADPNKPEEFARAFLSLQDKSVRDNLIQQGFENSKRFALSEMMRLYFSLHGIEPQRVQ